MKDRKDTLLTRRDFLSIASVGGISLLGGKLIHSLERNSRLEWLKNPSEWKFKTRPDLPKSLLGAHIDTPFLFLSDPDTINKHLDSLGPNITCATIFINDKFEPKLGIYADYVLDKARQYAQILNQRQMKLIVVLFDCYSTRETWNPIYGGHGATSPYATAKERDFYQDPSLTGFYSERVKRIGESLRDVPNLAAVTIANEPIPPDNNPHDPDYINWFNQGIAVAKKVFPGVPILPGVANPYFIPDSIRGLDANTTHMYGPESLINTVKYVNEGLLPLYGHEMGVAGQAFGIKLPYSTDYILSQLVSELLAWTSVVDYKNRVVDLGIPGISFWKKDTYLDGHNFDRFSNPLTNEIAYALTYAAHNIRNQRQP